MKLHDLYASEFMWWVPYTLLKERQPEECISHKQMPTWEQHRAFMLSRPHEAWYWFSAEEGGHFYAGGAIYLSKQREIGIGILKAHRRQGLAKQAITELMRLHPGRFLANINEKNEASISLFRSFGFRSLQITLTLDDGNDTQKTHTEPV